MDLLSEGKLKENWQRWIYYGVLALPVVGSMLYVNIWIIGALMLLAGLALLYAAIRHKRRNIVLRFMVTSKGLRPLIPALLISLAGILVIVNSQNLSNLLIDHFYNFQFNLSAKLEKKTLEDLGPVANKEWPLELRQHRIYQMDTVKENNQALLDQLPILSDSESGKVVFLWGPAGTGKTPLLKQFAKKIIDKKRDYDHVLFIDLVDASCEGTISVLEIIHSYYTALGANIPADYFRILLEQKKCLIILDAFDERNVEIQEKILSSAYSLCKGSKATLLIGSRPESIFYSDAKKREGFEKDKSFFVSIQPIRVEDLEYFIRESAAFLYDNADDFNEEHIERTMDFFITERPQLYGVCEQLNHLQVFMQYVVKDATFKTSPDDISDFRIMEIMERERILRNQGTHQHFWSEAHAQTRIQKLQKLAFQMSSKGQRRITEAQTLKSSGFMNIEEYEGNTYMTFSPSVFQDYFTFKEVKRKIKAGESIRFTPSLIKTLRAFPSELMDLEAAIHQDFFSDLKSYTDPEYIQFLRSCTSNDSIFEALTNQISKQELIEGLLGRFNSE